MRIVFDGEELKLPFCKDVYCTFAEFKTYFHNNLIYDNNFIDNYCEGGIGEDYSNYLKFSD